MNMVGVCGKYPYTAGLTLGAMNWNKIKLHNFVN